MTQNSEESTTALNKPNLNLAQTLAILNLILLIITLIYPHTPLQNHSPAPTRHTSRGSFVPVTYVDVKYSIVLVGLAGARPRATEQGESVGPQPIKQNH